MLVIFTDIHAYVIYIHIYVNHKMEKEQIELHRNNVSLYNWNLYKSEAECDKLSFIKYALEKPLRK